MSSKKQILADLRRYEPESELAPLPTTGPWIQYEDPLSQFETMVAAVGGTTVRVANDTDALNTALAELDSYTNAKRVCSIGMTVPRANVDLDQVDDPHALEDLDFAIIRGSVAVAENGAIWIAGDFRHRSAIFITQHLAIVVRAEKIVDHMHQAYANIDLPQPGYGVFVSGPSKTADIEQSLVIGAHGPRSLHVFVVVE